MLVLPRLTGPLQLPLLVIFKVETYLFPYEFHESDTIEFPCSLKNGKIVDSKDDVIEYFPEVPAVFEKLKNESVKIGLIDYDYPKLSPNHTMQLINLFGWNKYVSFIELHHKPPFANIETILNKSNIPFNETIYFCRATCYGEDHNKFIESGIFHGQVYDGITMECVDYALREFSELKRSKILWK